MHPTCPEPLQFLHSLDLQRSCKQRHHTEANFFSLHKFPGYTVHCRLVIIRREQMPVTVHRHCKATMPSEGLNRVEFLRLTPNFLVTQPTIEAVDPFASCWSKLNSDVRIARRGAHGLEKSSPPPSMVYLLNRDQKKPTCKVWRVLLDVRFRG